MPHKRKYRINELLENLSLKKNRQALQILPEVLGVGATTFHNYRNIKIEDQQDIPHEKVVILEQFFGIKPNELQNYEVDIIPISKIDENQLTFDPKAFGLTKS